MADELGPLSGLVGIWEGDKGADVAPDDDPKQTEKNSYRERMVFEPTGLVENHSQRLYGLRYSTTAWRIGVDEPFHEELGYWMWDGEGGQVVRCFMVPRAVTILAGGSASADSDRFELTAELGSPTYGICSNQFLDEKFRTVRYQLRFEKRGADQIHYWEDTVLQVAGSPEYFHHTDQNTLTRSK